ncbi:MAG: transposase family protein, partial [Nitrospira sp.]|nr:transposase family protein [Nitrospira sp.]
MTNYKKRNLSPILYLTDATFSPLDRLSNILDLTNLSRHRCIMPVLRSDNGLIFQSQRFRRACGEYRLQQEFITPYAPEQNGLIERFFRSL